MHQTLRTSAVVLVCALSSAAVEAAPEVWKVDNGIHATVYSPDYILEHMTKEENGELLLLVDDIQYNLIRDVDDPMISNRGTGRFYPMSMQHVREALEAITFENMGIAPRIFVLPFPRRQLLDSSARGNMIFLSPGVREVADYAVHFTVIHEIGHIFQYRMMPDQDVYGWQAYSRMRGISNRAVFHAGARHQDRPHEVFAEDFRYLFGGELANYSRAIENAALPLPDEVEGLREFIQDLAAPRSSGLTKVQVSPNPFNPSTQIKIDFARTMQQRQANVRIFDARGRVVRHLYKGTVGQNSLEIPWDGRNDSGEVLTSGAYFAGITLDGRTRTISKMMMVK